MASNKAGGIIMLISLFLPTILLLIGPLMFFIWMFGLGYVTVGSASGFGFIPDFVGIPIFILLFIFSIICIAKGPGKTKALGILSVIFLLIYYAWWFFLGSYMALVLAGSGVSMGVLVLPFIGFFGILIGAILCITSHY